MNPTDLTNRLALDSRGFESLKQTARTDPTGAAKTVAKQFDAIFVNMMLKQMRDASPQNGPLDSSSSKMYTSMLDQQLSQTMASRGVGVADQLLKQMLRQANRVNPDAGGKVNTALSNTTATNTALQGAAGSVTDAATDAAKAIARSSLNSIAASAASGVEDDGSGISTVPRPGLEERVQRALAALRKQAENESKAADALPDVDLSSVSAEPRGERMASFYNKLIGHASQAAQETGIPANFMIGHAALESGWGKREIKARDGSNTHNLFGIKAGGSWTGKTAEVTTTEYIGGVAHKVKEKFRAYSSYAEAFKDYANLLANNPRYSHVVAAGNGNDAASFAKGLQRAGYATDPNYAHKIMAVLKQIV